MNSIQVDGGVGGDVGRTLGQLGSWPARRWTAALLGTVATALAVGVPTDIVRTSFFTRMTPVLWWNYPVWALTAVLGGLMIATYVRSPLLPGGQGRLLGGGLLGVFAVGCPVCNKLVVLLLGMSGALAWFAPVQPFLAALSVALLALGLWQRLRGELACALPRSGPHGPGDSRIPPA